MLEVFLGNVVDLQDLTGNNQTEDCTLAESVESVCLGNNTVSAHISLTTQPTSPVVSPWIRHDRQ
jgi:hypothetical protein